MASISSTNVNELLPGLETFLRSMVNGTQLNTDHRQIASMYLDKLDQLSKSTNEQSSIIDDQSLINTDIITDEESDDFTDEEEEEQQVTPTVARRSSICDNHLYNSTNQKTDASNSQWYMDIPKNEHLETLTSQPSNGNKANKGHDENSSSITPRRSSISTSSLSNIIVDGLLLTYDKNHDWIWRYYVLDDFDLICFPADKKSRSTTQIQSDNDCSPLWVSDMTNAKVQTTIIDKIECLCIQIGLAEAIYVRPSDSNQINMWLKAFRDAASSQKSKDKSRNNVKTLSRNARRMFAQFNRKKGQIVSHLLDQMANVTGVDEKTRKHCELRGFLIISLDNQTFVTKYCTIVNGIFRIHKSRLSDQTDHEFALNRCTLSFPEERTRDIQFALIDEQIRTIFIRGNNIYSMGRLLNTLAKYVEIKGSSQDVFTSTPLNKHRASDVSLISMSEPNEVYSPTSVKSLPALSSSNIKSNLYRNASKIQNDQTFVLPTRRSLNHNDRNATPIQQEIINSNEIYDQPQSYDNRTSVDRNNNDVFIQPQPKERTRNDDENILSISQSLKNLSCSHRSKPKPFHRNLSSDAPSISSSPENTVFCIRSSDSSSPQHQNSRRRRRRPHPLPRRFSTDYVNKFTNLFTKSASIPISNERDISTQTYDTIKPLSDNFQLLRYNANNDVYQQPTSKRVYDIPITIERPTKFIVSPFEQYQTSNDNEEEDDDDDETIYDNVSQQDGIGKFRFVIPFNHSPRSAFTTIKPINSLVNSSSSSTISSYSKIPQISSSSDNSNTNNNNSNNRTTLMTAV